MATIYTRNGTPIIVDDADYDWLSQYTWNVNMYIGYATTSIRTNGRQRMIVMHRLIMDAPAGSTVDHINRNRADNRRSNLRFVTRSENTLNASKPRYQHRDPVTGKWWLSRGNDLIGIYDTEQQLHDAWFEARHGQTPAVTNTTIPTD
jgi:hypothetical protein